MAERSVKVPDIGEGIAEVELVAWHVQPGDTVAEDQLLADLMTDKATVEVPSPVAGKVIALAGQAGDRLQVGSDLIRIATAGAEPATVPDNAIPPPAVGRPAQVSAPRARPLASPSVRQYARERDIDLAAVQGSGPEGRIRREDIDAYLGRPAQAPVTEAIQSIPVVGLRRKIAQKMQAANQSIPHFTYVEEVDMTECEALRHHLNARYAARRGHLTLLPLIVRAMVLAIREYPQVNTRYDDAADMMTRYGDVHLGIATQTEAGLMVPVLRNAGTHTLWSCAAEVARLAEAARSGKAAREELSGSTITLTSLGALGGIVSTPIVNHPEVAIVGVNRMVERPVIRNGQITVRQMMNLSSSFDHRVIDGMDAAKFIQALRGYLEMPATLFIE